MDRLGAMAVFRRVVEAGSYSAAARALGVSVASVSKQVAALEARLGVRLLHRTTRRLALTEAGREYHARCGRILDEVWCARRPATCGAWAGRAGPRTSRRTAAW